MNRAAVAKETASYQSQKQLSGFDPLDNGGHKDVVLQRFPRFHTIVLRSWDRNVHNVNNMYFTFYCPIHVERNPVVNLVQWELEGTSYTNTIYSIHLRDIAPSTGSFSSYDQGSSTILASLQGQSLTLNQPSSTAIGLKLANNHLEYLTFFVTTSGSGSAPVAITNNFSLTLALTHDYDL